MKWLGLLIGLLLLPVTAQAGPCDGWDMMKPIEISHTGESNFQVLIDWPYDSDMTSSNYSDTKFMSNDNVTRLEHFPELNGTGTAKMWILLPTITPTTYIWGCYGNSSTTSVANGSATCPTYFESFEDYTLNQKLDGQGTWTDSGADSHYIVSTPTIHGSQAAKTIGVGGDTNVKDSQPGENENITIIAWVKNNATNVRMLTGLFDDAVYPYYVQLTESTGNLHLYCGEHLNTGKPFEAEIWYRIMFNITQDTVDYEIRYENWTVWDYSDNCAAQSYTDGIDSIWLANGGTIGGTWDLIFAVEYNETMPTYSIGAEIAVSDDSSPGITIDNPGNSTYLTAPININVTVDENADWCGYMIDSGSNTTMLNDSLTNWFSTTSPSEGTRLLTIYCNDTTGNWGTNSLYFTYDQYPFVTIVTPSDGASASSPVTFNCSVSDAIGISNISLWGNWSTNIIETPVSIASTQEVEIGDYDCLGGQKVWNVDNDTVMITWHNYTGGAGNYNIVLSEYYMSNNTYTTPRTVASNTTYGSEHPMPAKMGDYYFVFFAQKLGATSELKYINSSDLSSWSSPTVVSTCADDERYYVDITKVGDNYWIISPCDNDMIGLVFYPNNGTFSSEMALFTEASEMHDSHMEYDGSTYAMYFGSKGTDTIKSRTSSDGVTWAASTTIISGVDSVFHPSVTVMGDYNFLTWYWDNGDGSTFYNAVNWSGNHTVYYPLTIFNEDPGHQLYFDEINSTHVVYTWGNNTGVGADGKVYIGIAKLTLSTTSSKWHQNTTNSSVSGTWDFAEFTNTLSDGTYLWSCAACDTSGACNVTTENRTITIQTNITPPTIDFITPVASNGTVAYKQQYIVWNISSNEDVTAKIEINGTNQTATCVNATASTYCYYNETGLTSNQTRCAWGHAADGTNNWNTTNQYRCMTTNVTITSTTCSSCQTCTNYLTNGSLSTGSTLTLTADITSDDWHCINMTSATPSLIFDCDGYAISGDGDGDGWGILVTQTDDIIIRGCSNISYFRRGIYLHYSDNITIYNSSMTHNNIDTPAPFCLGNAGLLVYATNSSNITDVNVSSNCMHSIEMTLSDNNTFTRIYAGNTVSDAIQMSQCKYNNITESVILEDIQTASGIYAIDISGSSSFVGKYNYIYNNNISDTVRISEYYCDPNYFNTIKTAGTSIVGGSYIGGNYWGSSYTGNDYDGDGIGSTNHTVDSSPLTYDDLPLVLSDYGTITVKTEDGDQNWSFSSTPAGEELVLLNFTSTGNVNNTITFSLHEDLSNTSLVTINSTSNLSLDNLEYNHINITMNSSCPAGTYSGNITWSSANSSQTGNITIAFGVDTLAGDVNITQTSWSAAYQSGSTYNMDLTASNEGNYNLTNCNWSFTNSISASATYSLSSFTIENTSDATTTVTLSGGSTATDAYAFFTLTCAATAGGGTDSESVYGTIAISAADTAGGGGGGGIDIYCGDTVCNGLETWETCPTDCLQDLNDTLAYMWQEQFINPQFGINPITGEPIFSYMHISIIAGTLLITALIFRRRKKYDKGFITLLIISAISVSIMVIVGSVGIDNFSAVLDSWLKSIQNNAVFK